ncbi:MAG: hypothetical protein JW819_13375 [Candidatus Krumholzibacteriota bacterium]|nr:hypothetical protein [Candidatus Krumholzibacteriota bacterium]
MKALRVCPILILLATAIAPARAQQAAPQQGGIAVGPTLIEMDLHPGTTWQGRISVVAGSFRQPARFRLEVMDLAQAPDGAKQPVDVGLGARSAAGWIEVQPELTLAGGEKRDVPISLNCPLDAAGVYSAFIVVRLVPPQPESQVAAILVPTVAVEVLARVMSHGPMELSVESLEYAFPETRDTPVLVATIRNTGIWKSSVEGNILLYPEGGAFPERVRLPYRPDGRLYEIYPGQRVRFECPIGFRLPPGEYDARVRIDLGDRREARARFALQIGAADTWSGTAAPSAQEELGTELWLDDVLFEMTLMPGAARSFPIRVRNTSDRPLVLGTEVKDARIESDGSWTYSGAASDTVALRVTVAPDSMVLPARRTGTFRATVRLQRDAGNDTMLTKAVRVIGRARDAAASDGQQTIYDTGALIVVTPPERASAAVRIEELKLVRSLPTRNPGSALLTLCNGGGATGYIKGSMVLRRQSGQVFATLHIGREDWEPVMPHARRVYRMPLPLVDEGEFVVEAEINQRGTQQGSVRAMATFTSEESIPDGLR